jgi:hypothetical protein
MIPKFSVGNDADPKLVRKAINGLRAMAKLGKIAEKALRDIQEHGYCEDRSYWLQLNPYSHRRNFKLTNFPRFKPSDRDSIPGYLDMYLTFGDLKVDSSTFRTYNMINIDLHHPKLEWDDSGKYWWTQSVSTIGKLKILSSGGSIFLTAVHYPHLSKEKSGALRLFKTLRPYQRDWITRIVSIWIADYRLQGAPTIASQLRHQLPVWLVEDKFIDTWHQQFQQFIANYKSIKYVMNI